MLMFYGKDAVRQVSIGRSPDNQVVFSYKISAMVFVPGKCPLG